MDFRGVFSSAHKIKPQPPVFSGFGEGIERLNRTVSSKMMTQFGDGRAYYIPGKMFEMPQIYVDHIHALSIGEGNPANLLNYFRERDDRFGSIYMGAAGFMNFGYIAAMKPGAAILFDINPAQTWFWNHAFGLLANTNTPEQFMDAIVDSAEDIYKGLTDLYTLAGKSFAQLEPLTQRRAILHAFRNSPLEDWRKRGYEYSYQWMKDEAGYQHLREMAREKAIGALTLDVMDHRGWAQLSDHLRGDCSGAPPHVRTMYISNIESFVVDKGIDFAGRPMKGQPRRAMHEAISQVFEPQRYGVVTHDAGVPSQWSHDLQSYCVIPSRVPEPS